MPLVIFSMYIICILFSPFCLLVQETLLETKYHHACTIGNSKFAVCLLGMSHQEWSFFFFAFFHVFSHIHQRGPTDVIFSGSVSVLLGYSLLCSFSLQNKIR